MSAGTITRDKLLSTFTFFSSLPPEIKTLIWHFSLPGPRIIEVAYQTDPLFVFNGARPPPVFHACKSSRDVALSIYKPLFKSMVVKDRILGTTTKTLPPIYIDPAHDTIYLSTPHDYRKFVYPEFSKTYPDIRSIQAVAIDLDRYEDISTILADFAFSSSRSFGEIVLVVVDGNSDWVYGLKDPEISFVEPENDQWTTNVKDVAREVASVLCPGVVIRVMVVKTP